MEKMRLKNQELMARRMRKDEDERMHKEQEQARIVAEKEQRIKIRQKREDDKRIQSEIELVRERGAADTSEQREKIRLRKLEKGLEWDQDKITADDGGMVSAVRALILQRKTIQTDSTSITNLNLVNEDEPDLEGAEDSL